MPVAPFGSQTVQPLAQMRPVGDVLDVRTAQTPQARMRLLRILGVLGAARQVDVRRTASEDACDGAQVVVVLALVGDEKPRVRIVVPRADEDALPLRAHRLGLRGGQPLAVRFRRQPRIAVEIDARQVRIARVRRRLG